MRRRILGVIVLVIATAALATASVAGAEVPTGVAENIARTGPGGAIGELVGVLEVRVTVSGTAIAIRPAPGDDSAFTLDRAGGHRVQIVLQLRCTDARGAPVTVYGSSVYTVSAARARATHVLRRVTVRARCPEGGRIAADDPVRAALCLRRPGGAVWATNEFGGRALCSRAGA